jgi:hypothetical protein
LEIPTRAAAKTRLLEAAEREEIDPTVDRDLVFDLIYGGLVYRVLVGEMVDADVAQALADLVMKGAAGQRYREEALRCVVGCTWVDPPHDRRPASS